MFWRVDRSTDPEATLLCSIFPDGSMLLTLLLTSTLYFFMRVRRGRFRTLVDSMVNAECVEVDMVSNCGGPLS